MFNIFKKINWFIKRNYKIFIIVTIADFIAGAVSVITPRVIGDTIDLMAKNQLTYQSFLRSIGLLAFLIVIGYVSAVTWIYFVYGLGIKFEKEFRGKFYNHIMTMGSNFFKDHAVGDLMVRATTDLKQVALVTSDGFIFLLEGTMFLAMIITGMLLTGNVLLTVMTVFPLAAVEMIAARFGNKISEYHKESQEYLSNLSEYLLESVRGVQAIRAYRQQENNYEALKEKTEIVRDTFGKADVYENLTMFMFYVAYGAVELMVIYFGSMMVFKSEMTPGSFVTFMLYMNMLGWPLFAIGNVIGLIKRGEASYDRIDEVLQINTDVEIDVTKSSVCAFDHLTFNHFDFVYPDANEDEYALSDVSFTLEKGQTLGIVGKVGGGRTTLVKQLLGEFPVQKKGTLTINGQNYEDFNVSSIRGLFGYVPQQHVLFSKSVKDNLLVANVQATDIEVDKAIDLADFRKDMEFLQDGINTMTGESGTMLSGGQKQRLAIARAFLSNPEILVLDDALSAVDGKTEEKIIGNIIEHRAGKTNIIIAHRLSAVTHADKILVLDNGEIIESGTHEELIQQGGWYREQVEYQSLEAINDEF